jgi:hypothetical protein
MGSGNGVYTPENGNLTVIIRRMMISQWIEGYCTPFSDILTVCWDSIESVIQRCFA